MALTKAVRQGRADRRTRPATRTSASPRRPHSCVLRAACTRSPAASRSKPRSTTAGSRSARPATSPSTYGVRPELAHIQASGAREGERFAVRVVNGGETLARQTGLLDNRRRPVRGLPNKLTTGNRDDLAAIWRGAFLAAGSVSEPGRSASLDIACPSGEAGMALVGAVRHRIGIQAKQCEVRAPAASSCATPRRSEPCCSRWAWSRPRRAGTRCASAGEVRSGRQRSAELRRREPAPLGPGGRRGVRTRGARARDPRRRRAGSPEAGRRYRASRTATRASTSSAITPIRR